MFYEGSGKMVLGKCAIHPVGSLRPMGRCRRRGTGSALITCLRRGICAVEEAFVEASTDDANPRIRKSAEKLSERQVLAILLAGFPSVGIQARTFLTLPF